MSMARRRWAALVVAVAGAALSPSRDGTAQDAAEAAYLRYQRAIHAAAVCRHRDFSVPDDARMARYIDDKVNHAIASGKRLTLIEQAQLEIDQLVERKGCQSAEAGEIMAVFDTELAPLLHE
jgi:hypothetical protein